ncbi:hypothetical protein HDU96_001439 [Phlyctochytrium bullatum]|nr:hypothetical protein HDU96_001439 [Phlyctochytrium bullatum]
METLLALLPDLDVTYTPLLKTPRTTFDDMDDADANPNASAWIDRALVEKFYKCNKYVPFEVVKREEFHVEFHGTGPALRASLCAMSAAFASPSAPVSLYRRYFEEARRISLATADRPSLESVQAALVLAVFSSTHGPMHMAFTFASIALRFLTLLRMDDPDVLNDPRGASPVEMECRLRCFWVAFFVDRLISVYSGRNAMIRPNDSTNKIFRIFRHANLPDAAWCSVPGINSPSPLSQKRPHPTPPATHFLPSNRDARTISTCTPQQPPFHTAASLYVPSERAAHSTLQRNSTRESTTAVYVPENRVPSLQPAAQEPVPSRRPGRRGVPLKERLESSMKLAEVLGKKVEYGWRNSTAEESDEDAAHETDEGPGAFIPSEPPPPQLMLLARMIGMLYDVTRKSPEEESEDATLAAHQAPISPFTAPIRWAKESRFESDLAEVVSSLPRLRQFSPPMLAMLENAKIVDPCNFAMARVRSAIAREIAGARGELPSPSPTPTNTIDPPTARRLAHSLHLTITASSRLILSMRILGVPRATSHPDFAIFHRLQGMPIFLSGARAAAVALLECLLVLSWAELTERRARLAKQTSDGGSLDTGGMYLFDESISTRRMRECVQALDRAGQVLADRNAPELCEALPDIQISHWGFLQVITSTVARYAPRVLDSLEEVVLSLSGKSGSSLRVLGDLIASVA